MPRPFNYRRALLAAANAFLERTPASQEKAHRLVKRLQKARQSGTLDSLVWGRSISELSDSIFYEDDGYLLELCASLRDGPPEIHPGYFKHNYREDEDVTDIERAWYDHLRHLADFLADFPFAAAETAIREYEQQVSAIEQIALQTPAPQHIGQEHLHHFILREVTAALTTVDLRHSLLNVGRLIPNVPYTGGFPQAAQLFDTLPDVQEEVAWARRTLLALAGEGWLSVTWQVLPAHYLIAIH
jgi:hypothetical protein